MSPDDRRVVLAVITDEGRALAEEATGPLNRAVRAVVGDIGAGRTATTRD
jgi:DNA-binding MarR family transcriptional regulator